MNMNKMRILRGALCLLFLMAVLPMGSVVAYDGMGSRTPNSEGANLAQTPFSEEDSEDSVNPDLLQGDQHGVIEERPPCVFNVFLDRAPFVHPAIIRDLARHASDVGDQVLSVNITDSQNANRYCCGGVDITHTGIVNYIVDDGGQFGYRYMGSVSEDVHVLQTFESFGGGSALFTSLMFVRTACGYGLRSDGVSLTLSQPRYVVHKLGEFALGDRWRGKVEVESDPPRILIDGTPLSVELK